MSSCARVINASLHLYFPGFYGCGVYIKDITRWREDYAASKILFSTRENNANIFKLLCNVLFIIWSEVGTSEQTT